MNSVVLSVPAKLAVETVDPTLGSVVGSVEGWPTDEVRSVGYKILRHFGTGIEDPRVVRNHIWK